MHVCLGQLGSHWSITLIGHCHEGSIGFHHLDPILIGLQVRRFISGWGSCLLLHAPELLSIALFICNLRVTARPATEATEAPLTLQDVPWVFQMGQGGSIL